LGPETSIDILSEAVRQLPDGFRDGHILPLGIDTVAMVCSKVQKE
jgi:hypothetical protein